MNVRGPILDVGDVRSVETSYGESDLAEVTIRPTAPEDAPDEPTTVTLWGKWTHTVDHAAAGMELLVTDAERDDFGGQPGYATTGASYVVLEPDFLVDVTDVRSWVQCPRLYYLNKLSGVPLAYPVVKGTIVHEVFGDLLRGRPLDDSVAERVGEAGLELGLLGRDRAAVEDEVRRNAAAIEGWLAQGTLTDGDAWRSEYTLISPTFGIKGRADALRRGAPVELKTGKNTRSSPRFHDKIQAAAYALVLEERGVDVDTATLLYSKNAALDRSEAGGDLAPAKDFSVGGGLLKFVVRSRNEIAAAEYDFGVPTGYEADMDCRKCFEQDTCMVVSGRLDQASKAGQIGAALPSDERAYFDRSYHAVERERRAVHDEYRKLWEQTPAERADADRALVGLTPVGERQLPGGRWELLARRPGSAVSKLRSGDVALGSDGDPVGGHAELVRIRELRADPAAYDLDDYDDPGGTDDATAVSEGSEATAGSAGDDAATGDAATDGGALVVARADEPVALARLDVYPSELSVDRMLTAVHGALLKGDPDRKDVLFDRRDPEFRAFDGDRPTFVPNNEAQDEAVARAVAAEDLALIHGPPGTGKTYTIARIVRALVDRGERVLLSAFTNRAVDNALSAVRDAGVEDGVVRIGTETGVGEANRDLRLERDGDPGERAAALREASVVAATTASCGSRVLREAAFDVAVVDEASQLTEPSTLAAVSLADRFVLVGDHQQLPPVVRSDPPDPGTVATGANDSGTTVHEASDSGTTVHEADATAPGADLSRSLFERLHDAHPEAAVLLDRQYRMPQRIQAFSSREFYDGALRPATPAIAGASLADLDGVDAAALAPALREPVSLVDPGGRREGNANPIEADRVSEVVAAYRAAGVDAADIGVIAPFRAQVAEIDRRVDDEVAVDTVDRFQGSSQPVIVVSFVATGSLDGPIFDDTRRVNVALTRAERSLTLVGDRTALRSEPFYERLLRWADAGE